jgi:hypothetical protein
VKYVARETLGVDAHQGRRTGGQIAHREDSRFFADAIVAALKPMDAKNAELRREIGFGYFVQPERGGIIHAGYWEP